MLNRRTWPVLPQYHDSGLKSILVTNMVVGPSLECLFATVSARSAYCNGIFLRIMGTWTVISSECKERACFRLCFWAVARNSPCLVMAQSRHVKLVYWLWLLDFSVAPHSEWVSEWLFPSTSLLCTCTPATSTSAGGNPLHGNAGRDWVKLFSNSASSSTHLPLSWMEHLTLQRPSIQNTNSSITLLPLILHFEWKLERCNP